MLAALQRPGIRFQLEPDERGGELWCVAFCAGDGNGGWPWTQFHRRKNHQRNGRRCQYQSAVVRDRDLVGVGVAAESFAKNFKAIRQRCDARGR